MLLRRASLVAGERQLVYPLPGILAGQGFVSLRQRRSSLVFPVG
ncbi:MAG TPA: hypothetical protein VN611_11635 [Patescibacteria group bacterium]|nr:hypothetical protein [Patescibacteria group bacterium]